MATYSVNNGSTTFNLPNEGQVFRVAGDDNAGVVYKVVNGQVQAILGTEKVASTDLLNSDGSITKAGEVITKTPVRTVNQNYSGGWWSNTPARQIYDQQNGANSWQSLPTFNMADIQTVLQRNNGVLPTTSTTEASDPSIAGYTNPNANYNPSQTTTAPSQTTTQSQQSTGVQPPSQNLQPGMTGAGVKQLQDWLVSQGYMTDAQVATGPGIYGPQTTAAVAKWQQDNKVDNSTGAGYWGPRSIAASIGSTTGTQNNAQTNTQTQTGQPVVSDTDLQSKLLALGLSADQIASLDPTQKALLATIGDIATNTYSQGGGITLDEAIQQAQKDPSILAKYGDALKLDTQSLNQGLSDLQYTTNKSMQEAKTQFENDRKALAEKQAAAGTAYSGFRSQAQNQLRDQEAGFVESSRRQLQKSLNDATSAFESKWGTSQTPSITANFTDPFSTLNTSLSGLSTTPVANTTTITGQTAGGITGTAPLQQKADVLSKGSSLYELGQMPVV